MTTPDPFRALDGVEPIDRWDDIVDRAERPSMEAPLPLDAPRPLHRRPAVLAAAAVLVVLALGGVALAATGDDGKEQVTAGPDDGGDGPSTTDGPAAGSVGDVFWGRHWTITRLVDDGVDRELLDPSGKAPALLVVRSGPEAEDGTIVVDGSCAALRRGTARLGEDGVLVADPESWRPPSVSCLMADPAADQNRFVADLLQAMPAVAIDREALTITSGDDRLEAEASVGAVVGDSAADLWNAKWTVERLVDEGQDRPVVQPDGQGPIVLIGNTDGFPQRTSSGVLVDSEATGAISVTGCNGVGGPAHLEGDVLVADPGGFDDATGETFPGWASTEVACIGPEGEALMAQDAFLSELLQSGPLVAVEGDRLVIAKGDDRLEAFRLPGPDDDVGGPVGGGSSTTTTTPEATTTTATTVTTTVPEQTTTTVLEDAGASDLLLRGQRWTVVVVDGDREDPTLVGAVIDATRPGIVTVEGCNGAGGAMRLEGDRLVPDGEWAHTVMGCPAPGAGAADLQARDDWFEAFLAAGPTVEIESASLHLTTDDHQLAAMAI